MLHDRTLLTWLILTSTLVFSTSLAADVGPGKTDFPLIPEYSRSYDPARDAFTDGRAAIANATVTQRRILIELGGDWCTWCHVLDKFIATHPLVKKKLYENFVVLKINVSDANKNHEFLSAFPKVFAYPHMFVSETDGSVLYSKDTAELQENGTYSQTRWLEFIKRWQPVTRNLAGNTVSLPVQ